MSLSGRGELIYVAMSGQYASPGAWQLNADDQTNAAKMGIIVFGLIACKRVWHGRLD